MTRLFFTLFVYLFSYSSPIYGQSEKLLLKDWIKVSLENLSDQEMATDTLYTRYSFNKTNLNISFYPGWAGYTLDWEKTANTLRIGYETYQIEMLNDTMLTFSLQGFRRFSFLSESYISSKEEYLDSIGEFDNKPLFRANNIITPRYKGQGSFKELVQKELEGYNIKKAAYFQATFIVTEDGKVENVVIKKGLTEGFNAAVTRQLLNSSKKWTPARFKGRPIQTEMIYEIKYLDSFSPRSSGMLN